MKPLQSMPYVFHAKQKINVCPVDDLLVFDIEDSAIERLELRISKTLVFKGFGRPSQLLYIGLNWRTPVTVELCQKRLVDKLLSNTKMKEYKTMRTPINNVFDKHVDPTLLAKEGATTNRSIVDSLSYLENRTRRDIASTVNKLGLECLLLQYRI